MTGIEKKTCIDETKYCTKIGASTHVKLRAF